MFRFKFTSRKTESEPSLYCKLPQYGHLSCPYQARSVRWEPMP